MLKGVVHLVVTFGETMKDDIFKDKVGLYTARDIGRTAKERKAGSFSYAEAMLVAYNQKMKFGLKWAKLYEHKNDSPSDNEYRDFTDNL